MTRTICAHVDGDVLLTYKLNVEEAGTYAVTAGAWVGANSSLKYEILIDGEVKSTGATKVYNILKKGENTHLSELELPAGEVTIQFKGIGSVNTLFMYYFTLEKKN